MDRLDEIGGRFDERAARYHNPLTDFMGERELRVIRPFVPDGSRVLDYGCGSGRATIDLLRRGCEVTGYDLSAEMLAICESRARAEGRRCELTTDPATLEGRTWPVVTAIGVLDYYPDPVEMLRTFAAHVESGGRLVATFPNALSPLAWAYAAGSRFTCPATPRTPASARSVAAAAGLRVQALAYAAPALRPLGHTLVLALEPLG